MFCTNCGYSGPPGSTLGMLSTAAGLFLFIFGLFAALKSITATFTLCVFGLIMCLIGYATRTFHCANCGSKSIIPAGSPKANEFSDRAATFSHTAKHIPIPRRQVEESAEPLP
jgi:hypothetical protein